MLAATSATANFFNIDVVLSSLIVRLADRMLDQWLNAAEPALKPRRGSRSRT
jgi:hypothetical protein